MSNYVPRHRRETKSFKPKEHNPERDRKQAMYRDNDTWRNYRAKFLAINPECYACGEKATVCDHVTPHRGDVALFEKTDNHIPLCETCHNYVSAKFDTRSVHGEDWPKKNWLNSRRTPTEKWTPKPVKVLPKYE